MSRPLHTDVERRLRSVVGDDHVITDPDRLFVYESDGLTAYRVRPRAVVLPESTEEVAEVVGLLHRHEIEVIPRGAGTGLSGGALPTEEGVIVVPQTALDSLTSRFPLCCEKKERRSRSFAPTKPALPAG